MVYEFAKMLSSQSFREVEMRMTVGVENKLSSINFGILDGVEYNFLFFKFNEVRGQKLSALL